MPRDYDIVDAHTHVHPTAEAARGFLQVLDRDPPQRGDAGESLAIMDRLGISKTLILPWVFGRQEYQSRELGSQRDAETARDQVGARCSAYNAWANRIGKEHEGRFAGLCAIDPVLMGEAWARHEIETCMAKGALGLKVVPGYIRAYPADDAMALVWEESQRRRVPVISQSGGATREDFAHPANFEDVLRSWPEAVVVLAHLGMGAEEEVVRLASRYPNLYADTSYWLGHIVDTKRFSLSEAADLFRRIGIDRVLFGTNYPICDPAQFVEIIDEMPLTNDERRRIFGSNYRRLFEGKAEA